MGKVKIWNGGSSFCALIGRLSTFGDSVVFGLITRGHISISIGQCIIKAKNDCSKPESDLFACIVLSCHVAQ